MIGDGDSMPRPAVTTDPSIPHEQLQLGYDPARTNIITLYPMQDRLFVCVWLLDAFCAMMLVTDDGSRYTSPNSTCVAMDVVERIYDAFQTTMPVRPATEA